MSYINRAMFAKGSSSLSANVEERHCGRGEWRGLIGKPGAISDEKGES